jgi:hypothetical protein
MERERARVENWGQRTRSQRGDLEGEDVKRF